MSERDLDRIAYRLGALMGFLLKWGLITIVVVIVGKWVWGLF